MDERAQPPQEFFPNSHLIDWVVYARAVGASINLRSAQLNQSRQVVVEPGLRHTFLEAG